MMAGALAGLQAAQEADSAIALKRDTQPVARGQLESTSFSDVVKRVSPSVVKITTKSRLERSPWLPTAFRASTGSVALPKSA